MANCKANTDNTVIAANLAGARKGATFTGIVTQLQGSERLAPGEKRGGRKERYGDHVVHDLIITGFDYPALVQRSLDALNALSIKAIAQELASTPCWDGRGAKATERTVTVADVTEAIDSLRDSFNRTLNGTNESTSDHVWEPLVVDGENVRNGRVYRCVADQGIECHCSDCTGDKKAPKDGDINLSGLRIAHKVIEEAPNGSLPASKSGGKAVATRVLRSKLPVGRYKSYRLRKGEDFILRVGGTAALAAKDDEVGVRTATIEEVFGITA